MVIILPIHRSLSRARPRRHGAPDPAALWRGPLRVAVRALPAVHARADAADGRPRCRRVHRRELPADEGDGRVALPLRGAQVGGAQSFLFNTS
jgi:hypothetical protein